MRYHQVLENPNFVGRQPEKTKLAEIHRLPEAAIIVVSGRRRVGKTELIEQFFRNDRILKFEGIQTARPRGRAYRSLLKKQLDACLHRLLTYDVEISKSTQLKNWTDFFEVISPLVEQDPVILYFEEIQWLSGYQDDFLAELKPFWDDRWRHNQRLRVVISGSSPSFIASQFLSNKAIYNRSDYHISVRPFIPSEVKAMLHGRGMREILLASLVIGGVPGYLKRLLETKSVLENILQESFSRTGYFVSEYDRVFVSSLAESVHYRKTIELLAKHGPLNRSDLSKKVAGSARLGGEFTKVLNDLARCGFIEEYASVHNPDALNLRRYRISDPFLLFYHTFILPQWKSITSGAFEGRLQQAITERSLSVFLGFAFERWVRENTPKIAHILGFHGVNFHWGSFFLKSEQGFQIDLLIERADHTILVVEAKYATTPLQINVAAEVDVKINRMIVAFPRYKGFTIRKVLVVSDPAFVPESVRERFDSVLSAENIFNGSGEIG